MSYDEMQPLTPEQVRGPASEYDQDVWCVECGHWAGVHKDGGCDYWSGLCKCKRFLSRSSAISAEARAVAGAEAVKALREAVPALAELLGWVNTDISGCVEVEERGEKALRSARAAVEAYEEATGGTE
jgi:hypothetical protein